MKTKMIRVATAAMIGMGLKMNKPMLFCFLLVIFCHSAIAQKAKFPMIQVVNYCTDAIENKKHPDLKDLADERVFEAIAWCTKEIYSTNGNDPDSPIVKNFYTLLDEIVEDYVAQKITLKKAKAEMIRAWSITIDADNARQAAARSNAPQHQAQPQVMINPWERAHEIIKGIDPANQPYLDRKCYDWCTRAGQQGCQARCSR